MGHKTRIMYIEGKSHDQGKESRSLKGAGFKANYYDVETGEQYWISAPRKDGSDALYATNIPTEIDADVSDEYWTEIRKRRAISQTETLAERDIRRSRRVRHPDDGPVCSGILIFRKGACAVAAWQLRLLRNNLPGPRRVVIIEGDFT